MAEEAYPKDPKSLLQARYKAFEAGNIDFILETHHPETRDQVDRNAIKNWSEQSKWLGLEMGELVDHKDHAHLRFTVKYERDHETVKHTEVAEFRKHEDRWYYFDSEFPTPETIRREGDKVGRNEPCPCGSGKKYKKCHAA